MGSYPHASEWWCSSKTKKSKVKITGNENVTKSLVAHVFVKSGSIYVKLKPK